MQNSYFSMLVENKAGVLARIAGLIARRGFNINSLTVCATEDDSYSRMTISLSGDARTINQIRAQLEKQVEVVRIIALNEDTCVLRELLIIKIKATTDLLPQIVDIATIFKAKTIDISDQSITFELTGKGQKLNAFIQMLTQYGILELARSGASALERGVVCLKESELC